MKMTDNAATMDKIRGNAVSPLLHHLPAEIRQRIWYAPFQAVVLPSDGLGLVARII